jgi:hypothetical protein
MEGRTIKELFARHMFDFDCSSKDNKNVAQTISKNCPHFQFTCHFLAEQIGSNPQCVASDGLVT